MVLWALTRGEGAGTSPGRNGGTWRGGNSLSSLAFGCLDPGLRHLEEGRGAGRAFSPLLSRCTPYWEGRGWGNPHLPRNPTPQSHPLRTGTRVWRTAERSARLQQSGGPRGDQGLLGDKPPGGTPMVPGLTGPGCRGLRAGRLVGPGCPGRQLHQACPLSSEVSLWFSDCPPATAHHRTGREMGAGRRGGRQSSESTNAAATPSQRRVGGETGALRCSVYFVFPEEAGRSRASQCG